MSHGWVAWGSAPPVLPIREDKKCQGRGTKDPECQCGKVMIKLPVKAYAGLGRYPELVLGRSLALTPIALIHE